MSDRVRKIEIEELEKDIEVSFKRLSALRHQIRTEIDDGRKVLLEAQVERLRREIGEKENKLNSLKAKKDEENLLLEGQKSEEEIDEREKKLRVPGTRWEEQLYRIDFDKAEGVINRVIARLKTTEFGAVFLLQESRYKRGDYYVRRLKERLHSEVGAVHARSADLTVPGRLVNELSFLRCLTDDWNQEKPPDVEVVIKTLCEEAYGGVIFIPLIFDDDLKYRPQLLGWLVEKFWCPLITRLRDTCHERMVKAVLVIIALLEIENSSRDKKHFCTPRKFDSHKILELPLEMWQREMIEDWLTRHSMLALTVPQVKALAEEIFALSPSGLPHDVDHYLRRKLLDLNRGVMDVQQAASLLTPRKHEN